MLKVKLLTYALFVVTVAHISPILAQGAPATTTLSARVLAFSPQGAVERFSQVRAQFSEPMHELGNVDPAPPFDVDCVLKGEGHWIDDRNWTWDAVDAVTLGQTCRFTLNPALKALSGSAVGGQKEFSFQLPDIRQQQDIRNVWLEQPAPGNQIRPDQVFYVGYTYDPAVAQSRLYCRQGDVRMPVQVLAQQDLTASQVSDTYRIREPHQVVRCSQQLASGLPVWLGLERAGKPREYRFTVAPRYTRLTVVCTRLDASPSCVPNFPIELVLDRPIRTPDAKAIQLVRDGKSITGRWTYDFGYSDGFVNRLRFEVDSGDAEWQIQYPDDFQKSLGIEVDRPTLPATIRTGKVLPYVALPYHPMERLGPASPVTVYTNLSAEQAVTVRHLALGFKPGERYDPARLAQWLSWRERFARRYNVREASHNARWWYPCSFLDPVASASCAWDAGAADGASDSKKDASRIEEKRTMQAQVETIPLSYDRPSGAASLPALSRGLHILEATVPKSFAEQPSVTAKSAANAESLLAAHAMLNVSNLAIHHRLVPRATAIWVTEVDSGRPVVGADIALFNCDGQLVWQGRTGLDGLAQSPWVPTNRGCEGGFAFAHQILANGEHDIAMADLDGALRLRDWSSDFRGSFHAQPVTRFDAVTDRSLYRPGETIEIKHIARTETPGGVDFPDRATLPTLMHIVHEDSGQQWELPLEWRADGSALSQFKLPTDARLGQYSVEYVLPSGGALGDRDGAWFTVAEYRMPESKATLDLDAQVLAFGEQALARLQIRHSNGGPLAGVQVRLHAILDRGFVDESKPMDYAFYRYTVPTVPSLFDHTDGTSQSSSNPSVDLGEVRLDTDANGRVTWRLPALPASKEQYRLRVEASYADSNGEQQSVVTDAGVRQYKARLGMRLRGTGDEGHLMVATVLALDSDGHPLAARAVNVTLGQPAINSSISDDPEPSSKQVLCRGLTDIRGQLDCAFVAPEEGRHILEARSETIAEPLQAARKSIFTHSGNTSKFDALFLDMERSTYHVGETAWLKVLAPADLAHAWLTVERESIVESRVISLHKGVNRIPVKIGDGFAPQMFVSLLAPAGRQSDGTDKACVLLSAACAKADGETVAVPVNAAEQKPLLFGMTQIAVDPAPYRLKVVLKPEQQRYHVRESVKVRLQVRDHQGRPAAGATVAAVAVDASLLGLSDNESWQLFNRMIRNRFSRSVVHSGLLTTARTEMKDAIQSARRDLLANLIDLDVRADNDSFRFRQAQGLPDNALVRVLGFTHVEVTGSNIRAEDMDRPDSVRSPVATDYAGVRRNFDTRMAWLPDIKLDQHGEAEFELALKDALTNIRIVAIVTHGAREFGTGSTEISVLQDVQLTSTLPPVVHASDELRSGVSVRNTSKQTLHLKVAAQVNTTTSTPILDGSPEQVLTLKPGETRRIDWPMTFPAVEAGLQWRFLVRDVKRGTVMDQIEAQQTVLPLAQRAVQSASVVQLDQAINLPVAAPKNALPGSMLRMSLQDKIGGEQTLIKTWFQQYPYSCFEQQTAIALGTGNQEQWRRLTHNLASYMGENGLLNYFPSPLQQDGSDILTSHVLSIAAEYHAELPRYELERMLDALRDFVSKSDVKTGAAHSLNRARRLAALAALARYDRAPLDVVQSFEIEPDQADDAMLIDWLSVLKRAKDFPGRSLKQQQVENALRARLNRQGRQMTLIGAQPAASNQALSGYRWMRMINSEVDMSRLLLEVLDLPDWKADLLPIYMGLLGKQERGHWSTTVANVWGMAANKRFGDHFEGEAVTGETRASIGTAPQESQSRIWPSTAAHAAPMEWVLPAAPASAQLAVTHTGSGKPWVNTVVIAAVPDTVARFAGFQVRRSLMPVQQRVAGQFSVGDVWRVHLELDAASDVDWVAVNDPVPAGASVLGKGLANDKDVASDQVNSTGTAWPSYQERKFDAMISYFHHVPRGKFAIDYTIRLNDEGRFYLPPTRVEAMYQPEVYGVAPNEAMVIKR